MNWFRFMFGMGGGGGGAGCGPAQVAAAVIPARPSVDDTLEKLEARKETCIKAIEVIEKRIAVKAQFLQKYGRDPSKKTAVMQALRDKKQFERDLAVKNGTLEKITTSISTLQRKLDQADTVETLDEANAAMRALDGDPIIQKADEVMVELEHNIEGQADYDSILSKPLEGSSAVDELDLEKELEAIDAEAEAVQAPVRRTPAVTAPVQPQMMKPPAAMYSNGSPAAAAKPAAPVKDRMKELETAVSV